MGVRSATRDDLSDVARIHKARFGNLDYTLGQYSFSLITKFYASFSGRCVFLVHVSAGKVNGFLVGGPLAEVYRAQRAFVRSHLLQCCFETALHPRLWRAAGRFIRRSFLPQPMNFVPILAPNLPHLLSMAVDEAAEGTAAATALVKCFEAEISGEYPGYMLSVLKDNPRAIRFYKKLGLRVVVDAFPRTLLLQKDFAASDDTVPR